jgi:hypothetical protein
MTDHARQHDQPVHEELHPLVYKTVVALTGWLVLSIWVLFGGGAYFGLTAAVITLFFLVLLGIPTLLWMTWRHNADDQNHASETFQEWLVHSFKSATGSISGREATVQILLPIAAVSLGMTIFGLFYYFDVPHTGY